MKINRVKGKLILRLMRSPGHVNYFPLNQHTLLLSHFRMVELLRIIPTESLNHPLA